MVTLLRNRALRYRELACEIDDDSAREEILRLAAEYEQRAERPLAADVKIKASR
jgi:arsenate reductase-like glutaredoxin family protein